MADRSLIEEITRKRAKDARREMRACYPEAEVSYEVCDGRGVITACVDRYVVSKEFVENDDTLDNPHRLVEYSRILLGKSRLVVIVPKHRAVNFRLRMLELNNWWLCYYQIHFYDEEGNIRRLDRRTWRRMRGLPPDEPERAIEVA